MNELNIAISVAHEVGKLQLAHFNRIKNIKNKDDKELVTNVDIMCEELIIDRLSKAYDYPIISEEINNTTDKDTFWVVDPIDGTHNYIAQLPAFGTSIGLIKDGVFEIGVIYLPMFNEMFYAQRGHGAFLNNEPIQVSNKDKLKLSCLAYDNQYHLAKNSIKIYFNLMKNTFTTRCTGSAAYDLCMVSCGRIEGRIWNKTKLWDIAGGTVILREAGGRISKFNNDEIDLNSKDVIATNGKIHNELIRRVL